MNTTTGIQGTLADINMSIDESAINQIKTLLDDEDENLSLRVFVTGGGCSGFSYGFTFEDKIGDDDFCITQDGIQIVIDPLSYQYLIGSVISFESSVMSSQFIINNPNATSTCGCGSSFSI